VETWLAQRVEVAVAAGIPRAKILVDPGVGFAKAPMDNLRLFPLLRDLRGLAGGVLVGASRKRFIGDLTGEPEPSRRQAGSVGAALAAARWGADWLRVHDVRATRQALEVFQACGGLA
jgi:dihydropteroate synthase